MPCWYRCIRMPRHMVLLTESHLSKHFLRTLLLSSLPISFRVQFSNVQYATSCMSVLHPYNPCRNRLHILENAPCGTYKTSIQFSIIVLIWRVNHMTNVVGTIAGKCIYLCITIKYIYYYKGTGIQF